MRRTILTMILLLALPTSGAATEATAAATAAATAYHLIITYTPGGVVSVEYPSAERCEAARRALDADTERRIADRDASSRPGMVVVGVPYHLQGVCVPG